MKILYAAMKYDYGERERGLSFEHCTFFESLRGLGYEIVYFDFCRRRSGTGCAA